MTKSFHLRVIAICFLFVVALATMFCAVEAPAQTLQGNIVGWFDGDTVDFRAKSGKYYRVRLIGIDAPEMRQTFGKECKAFLVAATKSKPVTANLVGRDVYKRYLGEFQLAGIMDLSLHMIANGCAWEYSAPLSVKSAYQSAEQTARNNAIGLWQENNPAPPWVFRSQGLQTMPDCP